MDFFIDTPGIFFSIAPAVIGGIISAGGALASAGASVAGNKLSYKDNAKLAAQQNEYNVALQQNAFANNQSVAQEAYAQNLAQWTRENEYNTPLAQIERYKAAGLNPNLIYGTGSASAGNAHTSPQFTPAKYEAPTAQRATRQPFYTGQFDPYQAVQATQALAIQKAQKDNLAAQADYTRQQTKNSAIDNLIKTVQKSGLEFDLDLKRDLRNLTVDQIYQTLQKTKADTHNAYLSSDLIRARTELTERQRDLAPYQREQIKQGIMNAQQNRDINAFRYQLLKLGITDRDPFWTRILSRLFLSDGDLDAVLNY